MSKTNLTILDPVAYAEHLAEQNREASAELQAVLDAQPIIPEPSVSASLRPFPNWLSFAVVAVIAGGVGVLAGISLY